jgi:hypothetical protein
MSCSCSHTPHPCTLIIGCHTTQSFLYYAMQMLTLSIICKPTATVHGPLACIEENMQFFEAQADIPIGECPASASRTPCAVAQASRDLPLHVSSSSWWVLLQRLQVTVAMMAMTHWQLSDCLPHDRYLCYSHSGHLSDKDESLLMHAPETVEDGSQQGENGIMPTSISFM